MAPESRPFQSHQRGTVHSVDGKSGEAYGNHLCARHYDDGLST